MKLEFLSGWSSAFSRWMVVVAMCGAFAGVNARAQDRHGHGDGVGLEAETEWFTGRRGYLHGGLGLIKSLGEHSSIGLTGHVVRESSGEPFAPSIGLELSHRLAPEWELEVLSFGLTPTTGQHAWAVGARVRREFDLGDDRTLTLFGGPTVARVRAEDGATGAFPHVTHWMAFGGIEWSQPHWRVAGFGSYSVFNRGVRGLDSRVDLEEMTHFIAYKNNDGFARATGGFEAAWTPTERWHFTARYAAIRLEGVRLRHAVMLAPAWHPVERAEVFVGVQWLLNGARGNELFAAGVNWRF